jgi:hypothetical protein
VRVNQSKWGLAKVIVSKEKLFTRELHHPERMII